MKHAGWKRIAAGHYLHLETGIEIIRVDAHREHGYRVGARWHLWYPSASARSLHNAGCASTLKDAVAWATTGEDSYIERMRARIAQAWNEAHRLV